MGDLVDVLVSLRHTVAAVLSLDSYALDNAVGAPMLIPFLVLVIAATSTLVGQSVLLVINRISRFRVMITLVYSILGIALSALVQSLVVSLLTRAITDSYVPVAAVMPSALVAFAPYWFGFLVMLPYTGPGVARLLQGWHMVALWRLLIPVIGAGWVVAGGVSVVVWVVTLAINGWLDHSPWHLRENMVRMVAGKPLVSAEELRRMAGGLS